MAIYRVFMLGNDEHFISATIICCSTDKEAMTRAPGFDGTHKAVEVWELGRRIGRIDLHHGAGAAHTP